MGRKPLDLILNIVGIIIALIVIGSGSFVIYDGYDFASSIILGIYEIIFGVMLLLIELAPPAFIFEYFGFLRTWWGRALFLIFLVPFGVSNWYSGGISIFLTVMAIVYLVLFFLHVHIPRPLLGKEYERA
eukprot:TRINITY_DN14348_c0_g1_i1.p1 TRINITY_DN14348_c0_g1~~TRINITY_DN14348_c0_g1_i1.p1  ORF type:complete len:147 (+),score=66.72 TRINITY_DN14348_c0_g1_i1:54-443(+)